MTSVLDSSALLACLYGEPGGDSIAGEIRGAFLCAVNLAEAISVLIRRGATLERAREILSVWHFEKVDFDVGLAVETGALLSRTCRYGLSLADCACLALAARENLPVLTADRGWHGLDVGIEIRFHPITATALNFAQCAGGRSTHKDGA